MTSIGSAATCEACRRALLGSPRYIKRYFSSSGAYGDKPKSHDQLLAGVKLSQELSHLVSEGKVGTKKSRRPLFERQIPPGNHGDDRKSYQAITMLPVSTNPWVTKVETVKPSIDLFKDSNDPPISPIPGWKLSYHFFPSAYPHSYTTSTVLPNSPDEKRAGFRRKELYKTDLSSKDRLGHLNAEIKAQIGRKDVEATWNTHLTRKEPPIWIATRRLVREGIQDRESGSTMVMLHANGMPAEHWYEPLKAGIHETVSEVWILDSYNQNVSYLANSQSLGNVTHWEDYGRDIINFLCWYLPAEIDEGDLPTVLEKSENEQMRSDLIGVGHSVGGTALLIAQTQLRQLFDALILLEAMVYEKPAFGKIPRDTLLRGAISRRTTWPSRAAAKSSFLQKPFFQGWTPQQLQSYVDHGLMSTGNGEEVTLRTPNFIESQVFAENGSYLRFVFGMMLEIECEGGVYFVNGADTPEFLRGSKEQISRLERRVNGSQTFTVKGKGHLLVQEAPEEVGNILYNILDDIYEMAASSEDEETVMEYRKT